MYLTGGGVYTHTTLPVRYIGTAHIYVMYTASHITGNARSLARSPPFLQELGAGPVHLVGGVGSDQAEEQRYRTQKPLPVRYVTHTERASHTQCVSYTRYL